MLTVKPDGQHSVRAIFRTLFIAARRICPGACLTALALAVVSGILSVSAPKLLQQIIDRVVDRRFPDPFVRTYSFDVHWNAIVEDTTLVWLVFLQFICLFGAAVSRTLTGRISYFVATSVEDYWRYNALSKFYQMPTEWHDATEGGVVSAQLHRGGLAVTSFIERGLGGSELLVSLITMVFSLMAVLYQAPHLIWIFVIPIPVYLVLNHQLSIRAKSLQTRIDYFFDQSQATLNDGFANVRTVKLFNSHEREVERYKFSWYQYHMSKLTQLMWSAMAAWARNGIDFFTRAMLLLSVRTSSAGQIAQLLAIQQMVFGPLSSVFTMITSIQRDAVTCGPLLLLALAEDPMADAADAINLQPLKTRIEFNHVSFRYQVYAAPDARNPDQRRPTLPPPPQPSPVNGVQKRTENENGLVRSKSATQGASLTDINLTLPAGTTTAVVGRSGAGKSTISSLLLRFYDPAAGCILWDGVDLRKASRSSLRRLATIVPQDTPLLNRSVRENIAYSKPDADLPSIIRAAKLAHAHDFISKLPKGYDSVVGDQGKRLSGGQRQRIAIARALLSEPSVLVLDESSSHLDTESEQAVQDCISIQQAKGGTTQLIIAHRISTVLHADQIVVMDQGRIVDVGKHHDLLERCPIYFQLYSKQFRPAEIRSGMLSPTFE